MKCGKCEQDHATVAEVRSCYGLGPTARPAPEQDREDPVSRPTDKQWDFYRSLADQLGRHVHDRDRGLFSMDKISELIGEMIREARSKPKPPEQVANAPTVPEGFYAFPNTTGDNDLTFVKIDKPETGKWAGYLFMSEVVGGKPNYPIGGTRKAKVITSILEHGIKESALLYGTELGRCSRCNRHLTDQVSRSVGMGPECRSK